MKYFTYLMSLINTNVVTPAPSVAGWKLAFQNPWTVPGRNEEGTKAHSLLYLLSLKTKSRSPPGAPQVPIFASHSEHSLDGLHSWHLTLPPVYIEFCSHLLSSV